MRKNESSPAAPDLLRSPRLAPVWSQPAPPARPGIQILPHAETQSHGEPQTQPRQDCLARRRWDAEAIINSAGPCPGPRHFPPLANGMTTVGAAPRDRLPTPPPALAERPSRHHGRQSRLQTQVTCVGLLPFLTQRQVGIVIPSEVEGSAHGQEATNDAHRETQTSQPVDLSFLRTQE